MLVSQEDIKVSLFFKEEMIVKVTSKFAGWRLWTKARMVNGDIKSRGTFTTPSRSDTKVVSKVGDILYSNSLRLTYRGTLWWRMQKNVNYMHLSYTSPHFLNILIQETFGVKTMGRIMGLCFVALQIFGCWAVLGKGTGFHRPLLQPHWKAVVLVSGNQSKQSRSSYILWWIISLQGFLRYRTF